VILAGAAVGLAVSSQADAKGLADPGSAANASNLYARSSTKNTVAWVAGGGAVAAAATSVILFRFGP
jgi:hypothetical protein